MMNLSAWTGQSPLIPMNVLNGGTITVVPDCGVWEQFPNVELGQTAGMKYVGPGSAHWPFANVTDSTRGKVSGMDYTYCRYYRNANPTHKQVMVKHAAGGQPIHEWMWQNHMVMNLRNSWDACMRSPDIAALGGPRCADRFVMSQGEASYLLPGHIWADMVLTFMDTLRKAHGPWDFPIIGPDTRIAFCESPARPEISARNADMWRLAAYGIKIISAADIVPFDTVHADAMGLQAMGARIYRALDVEWAA